MRYTSVSLAAVNLHRNAFAVLLPELGLRPAAVGALQAATLAAYLVGQLPAGRLADQLGGPRVLVVGLLLWSAATALTGLPCMAAADGGVAAAAWALPVLVVARGLFGLASAVAMPCVTATSCQLVPAAERASAVSAAYSAFNVGGMIGLALVPPLAALVGTPGAFFVVGAAGAAWAALGSSLAASPPAKQQAKQQQQQASSWRALPAPTWRQLIVLIVCHFIMGASFFVLQNWIPTFLAAAGGAGQAATLTGGLSAVPWLAAALVGPLAGCAADGLMRRGWSSLSTRRLMQAASFLGCAASMLPLALVAQPSVACAVACLTCAMAMYSFSGAGFHSYLQDVCSARGNAGLVFGITNSSSIAAGVGGNLLTGWCLEATGSAGGVFGVFAAVNVAAAVLFATATSDEPVEL